MVNVIEDFALYPYNVEVHKTHSIKGAVFHLSMSTTDFSICVLHDC